MMNLELNYEGFEENLLSRTTNPFSRYCGEGVQYRFKFENRYGASVVKHGFSYGHEQDLWELAVIRFGADDRDWEIEYDTDITDDVEGYLTDEEVRELLGRIKELPN